MPGFLFTRRQTLASFGAVAASALSGCNTPQTSAVPTATPAVSGFRIGSIAVDTGPLVAQSGNPTAQWAQDALPGALAQAFAAHMAPGDPSGGTLSVRIDSVILGPVGPDGQATDWMKGAATLGGRHLSVRASSFYLPSPTDQALVEQAFHGRVNALSQAFAYWLARKWRR